MEADTTWPAVRPEVVAEVVGGLSARLQKRLDGAAAKLAARPVERAGDDWRVAVDEEAELVLHAPGGVVVDQAGVRCGCLLAPACVHRAAAVTVCRLAEDEQEPVPPADATAAVTPAGATAAAAPEGVTTAAAPAEAGGEQPPAAAPGPDAPLTPAESAALRHLHRAAAAVLAAGVGGAGAVVQAELLRAGHRARLAGLHRPSAAAVAVVTRIRAARSGEPDHRLADLVAAVRELLELTTALVNGHGGTADLRGTARQTYAEAGGLRLYGLFSEPVLTATHAGVLTWAVDATGRLSTIAEVMPHADATAAAPQAVGAGGRAVRLGDALLSHREFSRAGLVVQGATRSANGRLGAGASVKAVRAAGAAWTAEPAAGLWAEPAATQVERALSAATVPYESRPAGSDLLFLDVTLLGAAPHGAAGPVRLLADCDGLVVALRAAHDHPGLAFRGNLALLATAPGLRLRVIGRLERAARPELRLLAVAPAPLAPAPDGPGQAGLHDQVGLPSLALPADRAGRVNLGLERLQTADLSLPERLAGPFPQPLPGPVPERLHDPADPVGPVGPVDPPSPMDPAGTAVSVRASDGSDAPDVPVHLLTRRVEQAVTGGRPALALGTGKAGTLDADGAWLRAAGLATGALLLGGLCAAAGDQLRDVFGRVVADDHEAFTTAWLAAACYGEELASALCAGGWARQGEEVTPAP
ncbi:hypothetical protein J5Y04_02165 [Kitasatospora sp. RG8]|nr:hypothetical protein [Kitasatospora sp. RG8]